MHNYLEHQHYKSNNLLLFLYPSYFIYFLFLGFVHRDVESSFNQGKNKSRSALDISFRYIGMCDHMSLLCLCLDASLSQFLQFHAPPGMVNSLIGGTVGSLTLKELEKLLPPRSSREPGELQSLKIILSVFFSPDTKSFYGGKVP